VGPAGSTIASSTGEKTDPISGGSLYVTRSKARTVSNSFSYVQLLSKNFSTFGDPWFKGQRYRHYIYSAAVKSGFDWIVFFLIPKGIILGVMNTATAQSFTILVFSFILLAWMVKVGVGSYEAPRVLKTRGLPYIPIPFRCNLDQITQLVTAQLESVTANLGLQERRDMALTKLEDGHRGHDLIIMNSLHAAHGVESWQYKVAKYTERGASETHGSDRSVSMYSHYKSFLHYSTYIYVMLTFLDGRTPELAIALDFCFNLLFGFQYGMSFYITRESYKHIRTKFRFEEEAVPMQEMQASFRLLLVVAVSAAWCLRVSTGINVTRLLRPILLVTSEASSMKAAEVFLKTISDAKVIFMLVVTLFAIVALCYTMLFKGLFSEAAHDKIIVNSFMDSFISMFFFMTAGDNYSDLAPPGIQTSRWYICFFGPIVIFGVFFAMASDNCTPSVPLSTAPTLNRTSLYYRLCSSVHLRHRSTSTRWSLRRCAQSRTASSVLLCSPSGRCPLMTPRTQQANS